ncbi:hypothetical protein SBC1_28310 [Caballeronia sp. SBC1]|uniref:hypothetical protein n=1 Tax=Caballeronia sp. SBC1 TaxID=2705548 RepID=UPI00140E0346|nr:hypothetical protein [Caballeronia sp. SBC1]QIN62815.1 hypothetical protein SBC1_28310 [Caballeronia sp. SBC1]
MLQPQNNAEFNLRFSAYLFLSRNGATVTTEPQWNSSGIVDAPRWWIFFKMLPIAQTLMDQGDQPNFKQLIFEKKFRKSKKKIQSLIFVTFNDQVTDLSMSSDYFLVF